MNLRLPLRTPAEQAHLPSLVGPRRQAQRFLPSSHRPAQALTLAIATAALAAALFLAPTALAATPATTYVPIGKLPYSFNRLLPESVAINESTGHIYVADSGTATVYDFESATDNAPAEWNGSNTPAESFGGESIAVAIDNSPGGEGDVYVADAHNGVIDKFTPEGELIKSFGDTEPSPNGQLAGLHTPAGSFEPPSEGSRGYDETFGIAVDQSTGDLYAIDTGHKVIDVFSPSGEYLRQITAAPPGLYSLAEEGRRPAETSAIAVDGSTGPSKGDVYVFNPTSDQLDQFNAAGAYLSSWDGATLPNGAASVTPDEGFGEKPSVAVEDSTAHVFVSSRSFKDFDVFDSSGNFIPPQITHRQLGEEWLTGYNAGPDAIAIDQSTGRLDIAVEQTVQLFEPRSVLPYVTLKPVSNLTALTATLGAQIDPAGVAKITACRFEYISKFEYTRNSREEGGPWVRAHVKPCSPDPTDTEEPTEVSAALTGLSSGTAYRYRIVVSNESPHGTNTVDGTFTTVGRYNLSSHIGSTGSAAGQLEDPQDVAVNDESGDLYVADSGNHRIDQFSSSGAFVRAWGWGVADGTTTAFQTCTSNCHTGLSGSGSGQFETPKFIEVDNSTGPSHGDVYVADSSDGRVQKFDQEGNLLASWGTEGAIDFSSGGPIEGITVDEVGELLVASPSYWTKVAQDGGSREQIPITVFHEHFLGAADGNGIDIGPNGNFYAATVQGVAIAPINNEPPFANERTFESELGPGQPTGLALDRSNENLYVDHGTFIDQFDASNSACYLPNESGLEHPECPPSDDFGAGELTSAAGLAFDPSTETLYAADSGAGDLAVFSPLPLPDVATSPPANPGPTSATLTGQVNPAASGPIATCDFEYIPQSAFQNDVQTLTLSGATGGSFSLELEGERTPSIPFGSLSSLQAYLEQLPAIGRGNVVVGGPEVGPYRIEFKGSLTDADLPQLTVDSSELTPSGTATATLATVTHGGGGWGAAAIVPCEDPDAAEIGAASEPVQVHAGLTGITTFTTYYYRLAASAASDHGLPAYGRQLSVTPAPAQRPSIDATSSSALTPTTATLDARIDPQLSPTIYRFRYGPTAAYGSATLPSESIGEDATDHPVSTDITGLTPGTTYHFQVFAINFNGVTEGPDRTFSTPALPAVAQTSASDVGMTTATLAALLHPGYRSTTYRFEYGTGTAYGYSTPQSASIGEDNSSHAAIAAITGLAPDTTYHFRVVATNEIGTTDGPDQTFTTAPEAEKKVVPLPKCHKGQVLKHGRCVKNHKPHHKKHHKRGGHK